MVEYKYIKTKKILGKDRRVYKKKGSNKEYLKKKDRMIAVSDYKKNQKGKKGKKGKIVGGVINTDINFYKQLTNELDNYITSDELQIPSLHINRADHSKGTFQVVPDRKDKDKYEKFMVYIHKFDYNTPSTATDSMFLSYTIKLIPHKYFSERFDKDGLEKINDELNKSQHFFTYANISNGKNKYTDSNGKIIGEYAICNSYEIKEIEVVKRVNNNTFTFKLEYKLRSKDRMANTVAISQTTCNAMTRLLDDTKKKIYN